jgi:peptide chain release factor 3
LRPKIKSTAVTDFISELHRRRTFAIVAHPTQVKLRSPKNCCSLVALYRLPVLSKATKSSAAPFPTSWKLSGSAEYSVSTSVMGFEYRNLQINILDTPGHEDLPKIPTAH